MLSVRNLQASYGAAQVLFDISLDVGAGEVVTLLGRNGMGKTTTVLTIMGLLKPRGGVSPVTARRVVVLPMPLRPSSATTSPAPTSRSTPNRTWLAP